MTVLLPPKAAARVALSKSSAMTMPAPEGCEIWTWLARRDEIALHWLNGIGRSDLIEALR